MKFRLGLFENPFVDAARAQQIVHNAKHQDLALQAARESIVLLKNEGNLLPLSKDVDSIAVIGPNADHAKNQLGDYVSLTVLQDVVTVFEGIKATVSPKTKVEYVKGCEVVDAGNNEIVQGAGGGQASQGRHRRDRRERVAQPEEDRDGWRRV